MITFVTTLIYALVNFASCNMRLNSIVSMTLMSEAEGMRAYTIEYIKGGDSLRECKLETGVLLKLTTPVYYNYLGSDRCCTDRKGSFYTSVILFIVDGVLFGSMLLIVISGNIWRCFGCGCPSRLRVQPQRPDAVTTPKPPIIAPLAPITYRTAESFTTHDCNARLQLGKSQDSVVVVVNPTKKEEI
jgi:hypothetical protein